MLGDAATDRVLDKFDDLENGQRVEAVQRDIIEVHDIEAVLLKEKTSNKAVD